MKCEKCNGFGRFDDIECPSCNGTGKASEGVRVANLVDQPPRLSECEYCSGPLADFDGEVECVSCGRRPGGDNE